MAITHILQLKGGAGTKSVEYIGNFFASNPGFNEDCVFAPIDVGTFTGNKLLIVGVTAQATNGFSGLNGTGNITNNGGGMSTTAYQNAPANISGGTMLFAYTELTNDNDANIIVDMKEQDSGGSRIGVWLLSGYESTVPFDTSVGTTSGNTINLSLNTANNGFVTAISQSSDGSRTWSGNLIENFDNTSGRDVSGASANGTGITTNQIFSVVTTGSSIGAIGVSWF